MAQRNRRKVKAGQPLHELFNVRSILSGVVWPGVGSSNTNVVLALLFQQQLSQWWKPADLERSAMRQLQEMTALGAAHPFYDQWFAHAGMTTGDALTADRWRQLPLTDAGALEAFVKTKPISVPESHGKDVPVAFADGARSPALVRPALTAFFDAAIRLRELQWHGRNPGAPVVVVDRPVPGAPTSVSGRDGWDTALGCLTATARRELLAESDSAGSIIDALRRTRSEYLECSAATLAALVEKTVGGKAPALRMIRVHGEPPGSDLRETAAVRFGAAVRFHFATPLTGAVAFECPEAGALHVQSEHVYAELVDERGAPVASGERGRLVLTDLHNLRQPVPRYVSGWSARWAGCVCGRGLPVLDDLTRDRA